LQKRRAFYFGLIWIVMLVQNISCTNDRQQSGQTLRYASDDNWLFYGKIKLSKKYQKQFPHFPHFLFLLILPV